MFKLIRIRTTQLMAIACSDSPEGYHTGLYDYCQTSWWSWAMPPRAAMKWIRQLLKNTLKPWQKLEWCIPEVSTEFVAVMEDVLDLYEAPYDPARPVVCFDESPKQLIAEVHELMRALPARYNTGYEHKGVCDLMMICEPKQGFRHVDITDRRTKIEFADSNETDGRSLS